MGFAYSCSRRSVQSNGTTTRTSIEISSCFALLPLQLFVRDDKLNNNDTRMPTSLVAPSFKSTDETRFIQHNEIDRKTFQPHKTRHFSCLAAKFYIWLVKYFSWKFFSWKIHDSFAKQLAGFLKVFSCCWNVSKYPLFFAHLNLLSYARLRANSENYTN